MEQGQSSTAHPHSETGDMEATVLMFSYATARAESAFGLP